jgi:hypothetical protein
VGAVKAAGAPMRPGSDEAAVVGLAVLKANERKPSILYWVVSIALLLWSVAGASIYVAYFVETPQQFAQTAEAPENRQAYAEYVAAIPLWAIAVGIIAAAARLLGAVGLLLRRAWALPLYVVSLIFFLAALYRAFIIADVASVMSGAHIAVEFVFLGLSVFAVWFAYAQRAVGVLK